MQRRFCRKRLFCFNCFFTEILNTYHTQKFDHYFAAATDDDQSGPPPPKRQVRQPIALDNSIVTCTLGHREYVDAINLDGSAASSKDSNPTLKLNRMLKLNRNVIGQRLCIILR